MVKRGKGKLSSQEKLTAKHPIIAEKISKSLKESVKEGSFASAMNGLGTSYLAPFALALNATSSQIGVMNALVSLLPAFVQLKASRFIEKYSRKKIAVFFTALQALMFIPIIFTSYLFFRGTPGTVWILIGFVVLFYIFGAAAGPAWFSWMGSLVPEDGRGKYFSKRNRITGFFGLITMLTGGLLLDRFETTGYILVGFGLLFVLAMMARLISSFLFTRHYEPRLKIHKKDYFSFWQFLKSGRDTPFGKFTIFTTLMRISTNIAGPFFAVYMLRDLGLSYTWFMAITVSGIIFHLVFYPLLGKVSDKYGNIEILKFSCILMAIVPFLWLVSKNPFYLISVPQVVGGFAWAGFWLTTSNYIYDSVKQEKRGLGIAYYNLLNGMGLFLGAGIGAGIALLNISFMNKMLFIFLISGFARLLIILIRGKKLKEVRHVKKFSYNFIIREFHPAQGIIKEIHHLNHLKSKIEHYI
tara:strand:- start:1767 stop:3173 length:1407 start_codon:yes stop_codon:yes gene_type:complete